MKLHLEYNIVLLTIFLSCLLSSCHVNSSNEHVMVQQMNAQLSSAKDAAETDSLVQWWTNQSEMMQDDSLLYYTLLQNKARLRLNESDFVSADSLAKVVQCYTQSQGINDRDEALLAYKNFNLFGLIGSYSGRGSVAMDNYAKAYELAWQYNLSECYYNISINLSDAYFQNQRYPEAAKYLRHGLYLCDSLQLNPCMKSPFLNMLSMIYLRLSDYNSSLRYSNEELPYVSMLEPIDAFSFWNNRGNLFFFLEQYENSKSCFENALDISVNSRGLSPINYYISLINFLDTKIHLQQYDGVQDSLTEAVHFFSVHDFKQGLYYTSTLQARLNLDYYNNVDAAYQSILASPSDTVVDYNLRKLRTEVLVDYYRQVHDNDKVIQLIEQSSAIKDSLLRNVAAIRVADVNLQFEESMRARELAESKLQIERQRILIIVSSFALLLIVIILIVWYTSNLRKVELDRTHLYGSLIQEKIRNMRSRLSPHFLMNVLRLIKDSPNDENRISMIALTLRQSLEFSDKIGVTLRDELDFLHNYIQLLPQLSGLNIDLQIAPDVDINTTYILGMCIQAPLENAIKYAFPKEIRCPESCIVISVKHIRCDGVAGLHVSIVDNGQGLASGAAVQVNHGSSFMTKTISYLNMRNHNSIDMIIQDRSSVGDGHGVRVEYFFPNNYKFEI